MGRKYIVPYALYRVDGYISANLARKVTGFSEEDLQLLWQAIINMFEYDHSAARGNAPAYKLFDTISVKRKEGVIAPRSFSDYEVQVQNDKLPEGITCTRMI